MIKASLRELIKTHSLSSYPQESCGIINKSGEALPCSNLSPTPCDSFLIDFSDFDFSDIKYVYHSHPETSSLPSVTDIQYCNESQLPFIIYSLRDGDFYFLEPS